MLCHMHVNGAQVAVLSDGAAATRVVLTARASIGQVTERNSTRLLWPLSSLLLYVRADTCTGSKEQITQT